MNCREIEEKLLDEGTNVQESRVLSHLHECSGCRGLYEDLAALEKMNRSLRQGVKAPPDFYRKIAGSSMSGGDLARLLLGGLASVMLFVTSGALVPTETAELSSGGEGEVVESRRPESSRDRVRNRSQRENLHRWVKEDQPVSSSYIELRAEDSSGTPVLVRVPRTVKVRTSNLHHGLYWQRVSH
jgi:hypothetical protein